MSTTAGDTQKLLQEDNNRSPQSEIELPPVPPQVTFFIPDEMLNTAESVSKPESGAEALKQETLKIQEESLKHVAESATKLINFKKNLKAIFERMETNRSIIDRIAKLFGELPLWQKVTGGIIITLPSLLLGIAFHNAILALSVFTFLAYSSTAYALDDHFNHNVSDSNDLKSGIVSLGETLEGLIGQLELLRYNMAEQVNKFTTQNIKLEGIVTALSEEIFVMKNQIQIFVNTEKHLRETEEKLTKDLLVQSDQFQKTQTELEAVRTDYKANTLNLQKEITELNKVKVKLQEVNTDLEKQRNEARTIASYHQGAVIEMTKMIALNAEEREEAQRKFQSFIKNEAATLTDISGAMSKDQEELALTKNELSRVQKELDRVNKELSTVLIQFAESHEKYEKLLKRQENVVGQLEDTDKLVKDTSIRFAPLLGTHGLYNKIASEKVVITPALQEGVTLN